MFGSYRQRKGSRVPQVPSMPLSKLVKAGYCFHMFVSVYLGNFQYDSSWDLSPECSKWGVWGEQEGMRTSGHPSLQQDLATGWASRKASTSSWLAVHSSFSDSFYVCLSHWCSGTLQYVVGHYSIFTQYVSLLGKFLITHIRGAAPQSRGCVTHFTVSTAQRSCPAYTKPTINVYWSNEMQDLRKFQARGLCIPLELSFLLLFHFYIALKGLPNTPFDHVSVFGDIGRKAPLHDPNSCPKLTVATEPQWTI